MNAFQAVTRTIIMLGTLVVGTMAWQVYGPPPERLAPIVNRVLELANQSLNREETKPNSSELPPPRLSAVDERLAIPLPAGATLRVDSEVVPAEHLLLPPPDSGLEDLLAQLRSLGAVQAELKPWGSTGQIFRCQCRANSPQNPLLERHFDAIHADPRTAVEQVLVALESWRNGLAD